MVFPKLADGETLEDFVADVRSVASRVGGPAVLAADLASLTREALLTVPWAIGLGMLLGLSLVLRSPWRALLTLSGPSLALLFTQAALAFYHVPLNFLTWPAPAVVLLLGVSIALGTLRRPRASLKALLPAVMILLVSLFMLWSVHPGLAGLGLVMALGMGSNLLVAVIVLPAAQAFLRTVSGRAL
jgi:predicted RND superfamily exporter protein